MPSMPTQRYELESWLGDDHGLTDDQVTELMQIADDIYDRYVTVDPDAFDPDQYQRDLEQESETEREAALLVAYRLMVEPAAEVVAELRAAREAGRVATIGLRQAATQLVDPYAGKGARGLRSQAGYATAAGVDRSVVREWIGL